MAFLSWTLLALVQEFCKRQNLPVPTVVIASTDQQVQQACALLNETIEVLMSAGDWPHLRLTITFQHLGGVPGGGAENYLAYTFNQASPDVTHVDFGPRHIINNTLWCNTDTLPLYGPLSDEDWQTRIVTNIAPTRYAWKRSTRGIFIHPVPNPLNSVQFSFTAVMAQGIRATDGVTYKQLFTVDTDQSLLPGHIVLNGLRWRWRREKGLPYEDMEREHTLMVREYLARGMGSSDLSLDNSDEYPSVAKPGVLIPAGNWTL